MNFLSTADHAALVLYHTATGKQMDVLPEVDEYRFSSDGKFLATYRQRDRTISIWDIPLRKPLGWFLAIAAIVMAIPAALWWRSWRRSAMASDAPRSGGDPLLRTTPPAMPIARGIDHQEIAP